MKTAALVLLTCLAFAGCLPTPIPPPGPGPVDAAPPVVDAPPQPLPTPDAVTVSVFTGKIFNCTLAVVLSERAEATSPVRKCLEEGPPAACLTKLVGQYAGQYAIDTVACTARDLGVSARIAVRSGTAGPGDEACSANALKWISDEDLGYR